MVEGGPGPPLVSLPAGRPEHEAREACSAARPTSAPAGRVRAVAQARELGRELLPDVRVARAVVEAPLLVWVLAQVVELPLAVPCSTYL